jgi:hypothetical protein
MEDNTKQIEINNSIIEKLEKIIVDIEEIREDMKYSRLPSMQFYRNIIECHSETLQGWIKQCKISIKQIFGEQKHE